MTLLDRLERPLARFAVPGLVRYVVALNALVFLLLTAMPEYAAVLSLDRAAILRGEVWRVVSWIFIPETDSFFWILFYLMFTFWIGDVLEAAWGTFRLNAYYFCGMALSVASAFIFGASGGNFFLNLTVFFAVATILPNLEILVFFVIPVKIKWVALFSAILPLLVLVTGPLPEKMMVVMCLGNYLLFFGPSFFRSKVEAKINADRKEKFLGAQLSADEAMHRCAVCGITELTHPEAEFRVAADGEEYCTEHLPKKALS